MHNVEVNTLELHLELIITEGLAERYNQQTVNLEVQSMVFVMYEIIVGFLAVFVVIVLLFFSVAVPVAVIVRINVKVIILLFRYLLFYVSIGCFAGAPLLLTCRLTPAALLRCFRRVSATDFCFCSGGEPSLLESTLTGLATVLYLVFMI